MIGRGAVMFSEDADWPFEVGWVADVQRVWVLVVTLVVAGREGCALGMGCEWARNAARKLKRKPEDFCVGMVVVGAARAAWVLKMFPSSWDCSWSWLVSTNGDVENRRLLSS